MKSIIYQCTVPTYDDHIPSSKWIWNLPWKCHCFCIWIQETPYTFQTQCSILLRFLVEAYQIVSSQPKGKFRFQFSRMIKELHKLFILPLKVQILLDVLLRQVIQLQMPSLQYLPSSIQLFLESFLEKLLLLWLSIFLDLS